MNPLAAFRFFCHYGFSVYDASLPAPGDEPSEFDGLSPAEANRRMSRGWERRGRVVQYHTGEEYGLRRIDVCRAPTLASSDGADRVLVHNLSLPSGTLVIYDLDYGETVAVDPGNYIVHCRTYNTGVLWPGSAPIADDAEFLRHDELERYELVLVPGRTDREGVVLGPEFIPLWWA